MFAKVDTLIKSRNDIIQQIAHELAADKPVDDNYLKAAQENWKARNQQAD
ncbi:hypothetical protein RS130_16795 [Paraglaciecola aquimarina]|uniref:Uncharacterized protein n=1 Tax=Paraglaciecola aquimarina TaxID=1235557 RepID=A0ABU3SZB8_9ALTE|nr:hypothetical protein [Paraglaciecola aquimarina]MDU0355343.1 hypothetical protein [Paraglaciecola aquimarina]